MNMKKTVLRIILILLMIALPAVNFFSLNRAYILSEDENTKTPFGFVPSSYTVAAVEKKITSLIEERKRIEEEKRLEEEREQNFDNFLESIKSGDITYRQVFSDTLIVGDSLMQGLATYRVLDNSNMLAMVSASLYHLEGNINKIVANNPGILITHYGINTLVDSESYLNSFISQYESILNRLKEGLPDTRIFVSGIFNVLPSLERSYPCISEYNDRLKRMCSELEVGFLDNSSCLPGDGEYYGTDGIHVSENFYTEVWLPHLYYEINLK